MKHLITILALTASTTAFANRPSQPETFEQMCTRNVSGYGTIVNKARMTDKVDGFKFNLVDNGLKKVATCFVDGKGKLTFNVKDVKKGK